MQYTEAKYGRVFILRLENGDRIPEVLETFARDQGLHSAVALFIGGADKGSKVVVGPREDSTRKPVPVVESLPGVSEALGVGTIFPDEQGNPKLHLHSAFGRGTNTITGCTREGVGIWNIGEVVILELTNSLAERKPDPKTGFELLEV